MSESVLSTKNLEIGYVAHGKTKTVAQNININLDQGKLTCLMGPNGVGKSTLIKTLTGILQPIGGDVTISNKNFHHLELSEKASLLSVVLTEKPIYGHMTVRDLIVLGRYPYTNWNNILKDEDLNIINQAISSVNLEDHTNTQLAELSDGNLQKAIIGRALAQDTRVIILDEPTIHLDVNNKTSIIKLLQKLCTDQGKTILLSTHDLELATQYADKLWLFTRDAIIDGIPEDLVLLGQVSEVFSATKEDLETNCQEDFDISGDPKISDLVRQALCKANLHNKLILSGPLEVKNDSGLTLSYQDREFKSIHSLIKYLTHPD